MLQLKNLDVIKLAADTEISPPTIWKWMRGTRVQPMTDNALSAAALRRGFATKDQLEAHSAVVRGEQPGSK